MNNSSTKSGLSNISIDPDFSYEQKSEEDIVEEVQSSQDVEITEPNSPTVTEVKKNGPCLNGGEHSPQTVVTQAPTCEIEGISKTKCSVCKMILKYENITATGHDWSEYEITNATCTIDGSKSRYCKTCQKKDTEVLKAVGTHEFGDYVVTKAATCSTVGEQTRTCKLCNTKEAKELPKLEHDYGDWTTSIVPTCSVKGVQTRTCKKCGNLERKELDMLKHSEGDWKTISDPSCTEPGIRKKYCTLCGAEISSDSIPAIGHSYEISKDKNGTLIRICKVCGYEED